MLGLQQSYGNQAVQGLVRPSSTAPSVGRSGSSMRLTATIRVSGHPAPGTDHVGTVRQSVGSVDHDSEEPAGEDEKVVAEGPGMVELEDTDSVAPRLTYTSLIGPRADAPGGTKFGVTSTKIVVSNVVAHMDDDAPEVVGGMGLAGAFGGAERTCTVSADVNVAARWSVQNRGRTHIPDANSPLITATNADAIAADLKPNMSSQGGRPRRLAYWAQDLTEQHEQFHANERTGKYGQDACAFASEWLAGQTVASESAAITLVETKVVNKMKESYRLSFSPGKELRAYGAGAADYQARSDAVKAKGVELEAENLGYLDAMFD